MLGQSKIKAKSRQVETSLYPPVKAFLEGQGYTVKGEIGRCDVVAKRGEEPAVVVELKTSLNLELLLQGVERLSIADAVYLAVPAPGVQGASPPGRRWGTTSPVFDRRMHKLLRRLGLGLLLVHAKTVEAVLDPSPYQPRKNKRRTARMLSEFARRVGDPNQGGSSHRVKLVTAYRQEALRVAAVLAARGPQKPARLRLDAEAPNAGRILLQDVYGWFERVERGIYRLTPSGIAALQTYLGRFAAPVCLALPHPIPSSPDLIRRSTSPRQDGPADQVRG